MKNQTCLAGIDFELIGAVFTAARENLGFSIRQAALVAGVSKSSAIRLEGVASRDCPLDRFACYCFALGLVPAEVLEFAAKVRSPDLHEVEANIKRAFPSFTKTELERASLNLVRYLDLALSLIWSADPAQRILDVMFPTEDSRASFTFFASKLYNINNTERLHKSLSIVSKPFARMAGLPIEPEALSAALLEPLPVEMLRVPAPASIRLTRELFHRNKDLNAARTTMLSRAKRIIEEMEAEEAEAENLPSNHEP